MRFPRSPFELRLYKCYDSVRAWVGGLDDATGECGDVARAAIDPLAVERGGTDRHNDASISSRQLPTSTSPIRDFQGAVS